MFEIKKCDLAGRIGTLHTNHGKVETPAYVPVIHPTKQTIPAKDFKKLGFDLVITNAYITKNHYGQEAIRRGIHDIIDFDGAVMTDSGGYQVLEYGTIRVTASEMAEFETKIKSDIAIPLDKPTGFGLTKTKAKSYVDHTLKISKQTLNQSSNNGQIWVGPIQGSEHFDLVRHSTKTLLKYGFQMLALGSPVEFMESYRFSLLAKMIISAKSQMPASIPLHLFGAGHPLTIAFAIALGCDTFDSASYMLYAKQERYITDDRTRHLSEIVNFSCNCVVCSKFTPKELLALDGYEKINNLALHNLISIRSEVERVKDAIHEGRLWEYVMKKARAHPKLFEVIEVFTSNPNYFIGTTPKFKDKAIFLFSKEDQFRPEVLAYHNMVRRFRTRKKLLVISQETEIKPAYLSSEYAKIKNTFKDSESVQFCYYNPYLGLIPLEISDIFPAAHNVMSDSIYNPEDFPVFAKTWKTFFNKNKFSIICYEKDDFFIRYFVKSLPKNIKRKSLVKQK
ncbi:MAG: tRNA guanosine(15) transglycosylase TgtA [Thaumarchaeota archaeon]|nr:tRNA guanosine(15) transglycosylase TgtA [Nitrososphaerota archaeon]